MQKALVDGWEKRFSSFITQEDEDGNDIQADVARTFCNMRSQSR